MPDALTAERHTIDAAVARVAHAASAPARERWASTAVKERLQILRRTRHLLAADPYALARTVPLSVPGSLHRTLADTLVAEVLPLLDACRFLEREAARILAPEKLSSRSRPLWLRSVVAEVRREPLGTVLIIGPANYPLFLPGTQVLQALAAGNTVLWKPAPAGVEAALALRAALLRTGLYRDVLTVLDASPAAAQQAIASGVDKVFFTGHVETGRVVLRSLAESLTPAVMELSGCDAVFVLPGADLDRAASAIAFGLRLNGSATCMAPRRLFLVGRTAASLLPKLVAHVRKIAPIPVSPETRALLTELLADAERRGAQALLGGVSGDRPAIGPTLLTGATPEMRLMQTDLSAPVLSVMNVPDEAAACRAHRQCPYALSAAIFGPERISARFAREVHAGTVLVNDLIVSTADPRVAFGGRGSSGFGVTRGRKGLLEMTAPKTVLIQRSRSARPYQPAIEDHAMLFAGYIQAAHGGSLRERMRGLSGLRDGANKLRNRRAPAQKTIRQRDASDSTIEEQAE